MHFYICEHCDAFEILKHTHHSRLDLHIDVRPHPPSIHPHHRRTQKDVRSTALVAAARQSVHLVDGVHRRLGGRLVQLAHIVRAAGWCKQAGLDAGQGVIVGFDLHEGGQIAFGCETEIQ